MDLSNERNGFITGACSKATSHDASSSESLQISDIDDNTVEHVRMTSSTFIEFILMATVHSNTDTICIYSEMGYVDLCSYAFVM